MWKRASWGALFTLFHFLPRDSYWLRLPAFPERNLNFWEGLKDFKRQWDPFCHLWCMALIPTNLLVLSPSLNKTNCCALRCRWVLLTLRASIVKLAYLSKDSSLWHHAPYHSHILATFAMSLTIRKLLVPIRVMTGLKKIVIKCGVIYVLKEWGRQWIKGVGEAIL